MQAVSNPKVLVTGAAPSALPMPGWDDLTPQERKQRVKARQLERDEKRRNKRHVWS